MKKQIIRHGEVILKPIMDSTIEKEGNSLPHNTTEEVGKILQSFVEQFPHDKLGYYPEHDLPSRHHPETGEYISCPIQGSYTEDIYWFMERIRRL